MLLKMFGDAFQPPHRQEAMLDSSRGLIFASFEDDRLDMCFHKHL